MVKIATGSNGGTIDERIYQRKARPFGRGVAVKGNLKTLSPAIAGVLPKGEPFCNNPFTRAFDFLLLNVSLFCADAGDVEALSRPAFFIAFRRHTRSFFEQLAEKLGIVVADASGDRFYTHCVIFKKIARHVDAQIDDVL